MNLNNYIIIHVYNTNLKTLNEIYFHNYCKKKYKIYKSVDYSYVKKNSHINLNKLKLLCSNENSFPPYYYLSWLMSDKTKYETNCGIIIRYDNSDIYNLLTKISGTFTFNEIIDHISNYVNKEYLYFSTDYKNKFYHEKIPFDKYNKNVVLQEIKPSKWPNRCNLKTRL